MSTRIDPSAFDHPALPDLVAAALSSIDETGDVDYVAICGEHADLVEAVRASVNGGLRLQSLQEHQATADREGGRVLAGRYRLEGRLGAGAMGVVYAAQDTDLGRAVAVKILRPGLVGGHAAEQRFAREAEAMAAVTHAATITIHDRGRTDDGEAFLVMERLEGCTLRDLLDSAEGLTGELDRTRTDWIVETLGHRSLAEPSFLRAAVRWTAELAAGLDAAHSSGVLHRDVKPSNVFIRADGTAVLLDFGIAGLADGATITDDDATVGTPAYMAPESLVRGRDETPALDVYGLTATLYHLVTGTAPYTGTPSQILTRLATADPVPAQRVRGDLPKDLRAIIERGMARRISDRYASAAALGADLEAFLDHRPVKARPIPAWTRGWRRLQRAAWFWVLVGVAVLGCALGGWNHLSRKRAAADLEAYRAAEQHLPPNLIFGALSNRVLSEGEDREGTRRLLDAMVEHRAEALPSLLLRAAFRLDHGDPSGAASDIAAIAGESGGAYLQTLAERYRALPPDAAGSPSLSLEGLPEPALPEELLVAAVHNFRGGAARLFQQQIVDDRLDDVAYVEGLRCLLTVRSDPKGTRDRLIALEERQGGRSAQTAFQIGGCLLQAREYREAFDVNLEAIALAPGSFRIEENLGVAAWGLRLFDEARSHVQRAIELNPDYPTPMMVLARIELAQAQPDAAEEHLKRALGLELKSAVARAWARTLPAEIMTDRAVFAWLDGDQQLARELAVEAKAAFDAIPQSFWSNPHMSSQNGVVRRTIAEELQKDAPDPFRVMLEAALRSGLDLNFLWFARRLMPETYPDELAELIRVVAQRHATSRGLDPFATLEHGDGAPR